MAIVLALSLASPAWAAEAPILKSLSGAEKASVAKLIAGAKKEGSFSWATNLAPVKAAKALEKDFKKYYGLPGVKFRFANRKSGTLIKRFEQEIKANKLSVDVVILARPAPCGRTGMDNHRGAEGGARDSGPLLRPGPA